MQNDNIGISRPIGLTCGRFCQTNVKFPSVGERAVPRYSHEWSKQAGPKTPLLVLYTSNKFLRHLKLDIQILDSTD